MDWGEKSEEGIRREIKEEMGLSVIQVASQPSYFVTCPRDTDGVWIANVLFETKIENLHFTPSDECIAVQFVTKEEAQDLNIFINVKEFLKVFNPDSHII